MAREVDLNQGDLMTPKASWYATRDAPTGTPLPPDKICHQEGAVGNIGIGLGLRNADFDRMIGSF